MFLASQVVEQCVILLSSRVLGNVLHQIVVAGSFYQRLIVIHVADLPEHGFLQSHTVVNQPVGVSPDAQT